MINDANVLLKLLPRLQVSLRVVKLTNMNLITGQVLDNFANVNMNFGIDLKLLFTKYTK